MDIAQIRSLVKNTIEDNKDDIISVGEYIWQNPESGYREFKTSEFLISKFRELGFEVKTNLALTGFRADLDTGRPGPTLAIVGEMDSLIMPNHPQCDKNTGAVHACGHNACAAGFYGAALGLRKSGILKHLSGKIAFISTPAEEGIELDYRKQLIREGKIKSIAGKSQLIREGVFDDIDIAYMQHLSNHNGYNDNNGAINKKITFHGKSCHAGSPHFGKNALNAMTLALNAVALLRESYSADPQIRIHGIVNEAGTAVNIIPDTVSMEYMLRTNDLKRMLELNERFDNAVMYAAKAAECEATIESLNGYMPLINDRDLGDVIKESCRYLFPDKEYLDKLPCSGGSTDMGDVALIIPSVHGHADGSKGTGHGIDYGIRDPYVAYIENALINAVAAVDLLCNNAECGRKIAAHKKDLLPVAEYIRIVDDINCIRKSEDIK